MKASKFYVCLTITIVQIAENKTSIQCAFYCSSPAEVKSMPGSTVQREVHDSVGRLGVVHQEVRADGSILEPKSQEPLLAEYKPHSKLEQLMG